MLCDGRAVGERSFGVADHLAHGARGILEAPADELVRLQPRLMRVRACRARHDSVSADRPVAYGLRQVDRLHGKPRRHVDRRHPDHAVEVNPDQRGAVVLRQRKRELLIGCRTAGAPHRARRRRHGGEYVRHPVHAVRVGRLRHEVHNRDPRRHSHVHAAREVRLRRRQRHGIQRVRATTASGPAATERGRVRFGAGHSVDVDGGVLVNVEEHV